MLPMMNRIRLPIFGAIIALCAAANPTPVLAQSVQCVDDSELTAVDGTITSLTPQPYDAGATSISGHWIVVSVPTMSCGGFAMYVLDIGVHGLDGHDGQLCQIGSTIEVNGKLFAPDADRPNEWKFSSDSMIPAVYGSDFTCR
jgi:hypothetical protein